MKVALCIHGQPRTFEFCFPSIKTNIIDKYNPDIFICTDSQETKIRELYRPTKMMICLDDDINKYLGVRRFSYGKVIPCPHWPTFQIRPPEVLIAMYRMLKCKEMLQKYENQYGRYDVVITTRFDIKFLHIQPILLPDENVFYIPRVDANQWTADEQRLHWVLGHSAHIWWGTSKLTEKILDSYSWSDEHFKLTGIFCGETLTKSYCDKNNIEVQYTDVEQMIIRGTKERPMAWDKMPLSATYYPQYLDPPLPTKNHIPFYEPWIGKQWVDIKERVIKQYSNEHHSDRRERRKLERKLRREHT
jgi:hypothetical protein